MVTVRRLAELVSERYGVPISFVSARHGDPQSARISSAEASRVLGWHAEVTFEDGLDALLASGDGERAMSANGSLAVASSQVEPTRY
jgi:nucleoside-diphosphate-sugar epimerase